MQSYQKTLTICALCLGVAISASYTTYVVSKAYWYPVGLVDASELMLASSAIQQANRTAMVLSLSEANDDRERHIASLEKLMHSEVCDYVNYVAKPRPQRGDLGDEFAKIEFLLLSVHSSVAEYFRANRTTQGIESDPCLSKLLADYQL